MATGRTVQRKPRPPRAARVPGYLLAIAINLALVYLVAVRPGWRAVPFLAEEFSAVVGLVLVSFLVGVGVNLVYVVFDPRWVRYLGEAVTAAVGFGVLLLLVTVFPFDVAATWETPIRVLLVLGCVGCAIGVLSNLGLAARAAMTAEELGAVRGGRP